MKFDDVHGSEQAEILANSIYNCFLPRIFLEEIKKNGKRTS
jgi:hypothetical protein